MRLVAYLRCIGAKFLKPAQMELEMEEELGSHIECRADDLERSGLDRAEAERRARVEFGGRQRFKEEAREALGGNFAENLARDVRLSIRVLRKSPGFTLIAVFTLALSIGANSIVFALLNSFILRPSNIPNSESLYGIQHGRGHWMGSSYPDYLDLRDRNRSFDGLAAFSIAQAGFDTGESAVSVWCQESSGNFFDALRLQPYVGRFFHASDERGPNSAPFVVLSYSFWRNHFAGDRGVVGRVVRLNKHPFTIIGVSPPEFHGILLFGDFEIATPLVNQEQIEGQNNLNSRGIESVFMTIGHLKPGVTPAQAVSDLNSIGAYLRQNYPKEQAPADFSLGRPSLYGEYFGGPVRAFLTALMLLAGLILLAACANLGSLFTARATDRSREIALRLAMGAGRSRILRALLTEAILIALMGGAAGLFGSMALLQALNAWQPVPRYPQFHIPVYVDSRVYVVALALALLSGLLFGIVPAKQVLATDPYQVVKSGARETGRRRFPIRELLLAVQIAICAVLVTSSMVAVRGLLRSLHSDFGFEPANAMLMDTNLEMAGYRGDAVVAMQKRVLDGVGKIPGVQSAGLIDWLPLEGAHSNSSAIFREDTADLRTSNAAAWPAVYRVSPGYFDAARTTLLSGRAFTWHDDKDAPRVAVINNQFARKLFGSVTKAIGRHYKMPDGARVEVVGVVQDGKYASLTEDPQPAMFFPILQAPSSAASVVVRSHRDPMQLAAAMRSVLRSLDSGLPSYVESWRQELELPLFPSRMATIALGVLGMMGAMLSITGIFGMAAYSVGRRLRELGIRLALGAQRSEILQAALGRSIKLLAFGSAAGLVLGIFASRVLAFIVYQATPRDPFVLTGVVVAMALLGVLATWIPAQRALRLDPVTLLREE